MNKLLPENAPYVQWTDPRLGGISKLRLISDRGYPNWSVSFCYGYLKTGEPVRVNLPFHELPKGRNMKNAILKHAIKDNVFAKRLNLFNDLVYSFLQ